MMEASSAKKSIQPSKRRSAVCLAKLRSASRSSCSHSEACAAGDKGRDVGFWAARVVAASENANRKINKRRIFNSVLRVAADHVWTYQGGLTDFTTDFTGDCVRKNVTLSEPEWIAQPVEMRC